MTDHSLYVGYLPLPPRHARMLRIAIPVALWVLLALNAVSVWAMRDPGSAAWNTDDTVTLTGRLVDHGAPVLITDDGETVLLTRDSKRGPFDGPTREGRVEATGFILVRHGRRMLEITQAESERVASRDVGEQLRRAFPSTTPITLRGEILDAKCYLGAMKPGDGKGHKACATLCIRGGVPAAIRIRTPSGAESIALVFGPGFTPFPETLLEYVGDAVECSGKHFRIGDIDAIAVDPTTVRRLSR
jgi:hypothetical protein